LLPTDRTAKKLAEREAALLAAEDTLTKQAEELEAAQSGAATAAAEAEISSKRFEKQAEDAEKLQKAQEAAAVEAEAKLAQAQASAEAAMAAKAWGVLRTSTQLTYNLLPL
jgi:hypothetical protein